MATLLGHAGACTSLAEFRLQILEDLRRFAGCDGALLRPGERWAGSRTLYVNEDCRFTDVYVENAARFGPELQRWCALSRGAEAFIDGDVYESRQQDRMAAYGDMIKPHGIRSILACPLTVAGAPVGLVFLFRRGSAARFPTQTAAVATRLLSALALTDRLLETAFARGRPMASARPASPGDAAFEALGPREQQVAALMAHGLQSKEIAALLGSSPHTVHVQTQRIFDKLGLHGRTQVALLTQQIGLAAHAAAGGDPMLASFGALLCRKLVRRFGDPAAPAPAAPPAGDRVTALGARERQVAELMARGMTSRAIAALIGTSFHTVRAQTQRIYEKLGVRGRTGLALLLSGSTDSPFA
jgi:DNA-binding NarL/FixJ family response regulator